jgi:DNA invertase Pin-like site-specific DNA recombinase
MTGKIQALHLERRAYVYVRQSTAMQVFENTESTKRQYALVDRAHALGWPEHAVEVIDEDLGRSGASEDGRTGFARLAEAVANGEAGAIVALEVSRLARCSQDWQRLLALCAVAQVVVIDEHAVYDPQNCDDKLLLDFKGTMSEAELHWLGLRLTGARRSKARRGELRMLPPTGYVWGERGMELDPDEAVQQAVRTVFERFAIEPSAGAVVRWARRTGFRMPTRHSHADGTSELVWKSLGSSRLVELLHHPVYAGCYVYGRRPQRKILVDGEIRCVRRLACPDEWLARIEGAHPGYITWQTYSSNLKKLRDNTAQFHPVSPGPPREGSAMLAGILVCGRCGRRMRPTYWRKSEDDDRFSYSCLGEHDRGAPRCWAVKGPPIDEAVEKLFLTTMVPDELELCLAVEREVGAQADSLDDQWRLRLEKADYEARCAERRYKAVDPDNRVVARTLENDWEQRLRELEEVRRHYDAAKRDHRVQLSEADRARIRELASDLPAVWRAPTTKLAERKAMLREVFEAVTLHPIDVPERQTLIRAQWQSGAITELKIDRPTRIDSRRTPKGAITRVRELAAEGLHDEDIADQLNAEEIATATGGRWTIHSVRWARRKYAIVRLHEDRPRSIPLPDRHPDGRYSVRGAMKRFGVSDTVIRRWIKDGLIDSSREDFKRRRDVYWLRIDDEDAKRLEKVAARSRKHRSARKRRSGGFAS